MFQDVTGINKGKTTFNITNGEVSIKAKILFIQS